MIYEGLDPAALSAHLGVPSCLVSEKVTSTLDIIHQLAEEGAPANTLVLADEQVGGRGRHGRTWLSPKGSGIWLGNLQRVPQPIESGVLALRVGLCVTRALSSLDVGAAIKWPNDIMLHDRKLAGILCEARSGDAGRWVAVGIGINVYGPLPAEIADRAISLDAVLPTVTRLAVLGTLIPLLAAISHSPKLTRQECADFLERDWLVGRRVLEPVVGRVQGIDRDGALVVETAGRHVERVIGGQVVAA